MKDFHFVQSQPIFNVNNEDYELVDSVDGQGDIKRLNHKSTKLHFIFFKGTLIDETIESIFNSDNDLSEFCFSAYNIDLPSFLITQEPGLIIQTRILFIPNAETEIVESKELIDYKFGLQEAQSERLRDSLKNMNIIDLFHGEYHLFRNGATCPRSSAFFPLIKKLKSDVGLPDKFAFIDCFKMPNIRKNSDLYYYLPIYAPLDEKDENGRVSESYPNIYGGMFVFFALFNLNEFNELNRVLANYVKSFSDINNVEASTSFLDNGRWALSHQVSDGLEFSLKFKDKYVFGYRNDSYKFKNPS